MEIKQLALILGVKDFPNLSFESISIDSRKIKSGQCFIAIQGENFDGHDYLEQAKNAGAVCAIVSKKISCDIPQIVVSDTTIALGKIAAFHRQQFSPSCIALTGSCGKTSVKEMLVSIFSQLGEVLAPEGSFNNHIGVPLTLLKMTAKHDYAVFELGANHPGEIAYLSDLVKPQIALINNVAPAHIQGFGDVNGVAKAKGEIYDALDADGIAIVNLDDDFANSWMVKLQDKRVVTFALDNDTADITAHSIVLHKDKPTHFTIVTPDEQGIVELPLPGKHNVRNALAATAVAFASGIKLPQIIAGLSSMKSVMGRMCLRSAKSGAIVFDDTYNANPSSVKAAIDTLATYPGTRILVLGDMGELGEQASTYHSEIGDYAKNAGVDSLFTVGTLTQHASDAFGSNAYHFVNQESLVEKLELALQQDVTCIVKGSRSAKMENVIHAICE